MPAHHTVAAVLSGAAPNAAADLGSAASLAVASTAAAGGPPAFLVEIAVIVAAAALVAYVSFRLGMVPIVGFLLAGVLIGPNALALVRNPELVEAAAEVGVILLLFTIGIEFSLERLARIKRLILAGGGLQVGVTTAATVGILAALGVDWRVGLFTGFLVALSSTAIVLKLLSDRHETSAPHGQAGLGLLIFQDLAIIAMVLLLPLLAVGEAATGPEGASAAEAPTATAGGSAAAVAWALGKAVLVVAAVLALARRLMSPLLEVVQRTCSPELFLLAVVAICFGTAWVTSLAGVSVALGAFLAGLIVSESRFSEHAMTEILPLQILFSATFFVSIGMLLDPAFLIANLPLVLGVVAAVLALKVLITGASVAALGYPLPVAAASALLLAQVGEFSFVLERAGRAFDLYPAGLAGTGSQTFLAATVLLMILTPFLALAGARLARGLEERRREGEAERMAEAEPADEYADLGDHVIVAGYGDVARRIVPVLRDSGIPYLITTLNPGGAEEAERDGHPVFRGDASRAHFLQAAGVKRATLFAVLDDLPAMAARIVSVARPLNPGMRILVRTRYPADVYALIAAGADRVVSEETEAAVELLADALSSHGVSRERIVEHAEAFRAAGDGGRTRAAHGQPTVSRTEGEGERMNRRDVDTERTIELRTNAGPSVCSHLQEARPIRPGTRGCEECLQLGDNWVHLRVCMSCGHVGCCDSSKNRHASKHHASTGHPIVKSLEPGEEWGWCYADEAFLTPG